MTTLAQGQRIARKAHECALCGGEIPTGTNYEWWKNVESAGFYNGKAHLLCQWVLWKYQHKYGNYDDDSLPWPPDFRSEVLNGFAVEELHLPSDCQEGCCT